MLPEGFNVVSLNLGNDRPYVGAQVAHWGPGPGRPLSAAHPVQVWCRCITVVFNYFVVTNFFWMFVEGCYLHTAIVMAYSTERLRKWLFLVIGWCEGPPEGDGAKRGWGCCRQGHLSSSWVHGQNHSPAHHPRDNPWRSQSPACWPGGIR